MYFACNVDVQVELHGPDHGRMAHAPQASCFRAWALAMAPTIGWPAAPQSCDLAATAQPISNGGRLFHCPFGNAETQNHSAAPETTALTHNIARSRLLDMAASHDPSSTPGDWASVSAATAAAVVPVPSRHLAFILKLHTRECLLAGATCWPFIPS